MAQTKERVKRRVKQELKRARSPEVVREVLQELERVAAVAVTEKQEGKVPGQTRAGTKTSYTYQDLCLMFPIVSFAPDETILLTFNGVAVQAFSGVEMHVPKCFQDVYRSHQRATRDSLKDLRNERLGLDIVPGGGPLAPEL